MSESKYDNTVISQLIDLLTKLDIRRAQINSNLVAWWSPDSDNLEIYIKSKRMKIWFRWNGTKFDSSVQLSSQDQNYLKKSIIEYFQIVDDISNYSLLDTLKD